MNLWKYLHRNSEQTFCVSSGVYFYRFEAASLDDPNKRFTDVKKLLLIKQRNKVKLLKVKKKAL
ncbi:MAG: hypothetical protein KGJ59_10490 [Bacteroidota bacterium]|nr:hypothetical protein [Bacteroidota bacterium]